MSPSIKPGFSGPLEVRELDESQWELTAPLEYTSRVLKCMIHIPAGFVTDFASIPKFLPAVYAVLSSVGRRAAVVHDFLYQTHRAYGAKITRRQADLTFYEALKALGVGRVKREIFYLGVRVGGLTSWWTGQDRFEVLNGKK